MFRLIRRLLICGYRQQLHKPTWIRHHIIIISALYPIHHHRPRPWVTLTTYPCSAAGDEPTLNVPDNCRTFGVICLNQRNNNALIVLLIIIMMDTNNNNNNNNVLWWWSAGGTRQVIEKHRQTDPIAYMYLEDLVEKDIVNKKSQLRLSVLWLKR